MVGLDYPAVEWVGEHLSPPVDIDEAMLKKLQVLELHELRRRAGRSDDEGGGEDEEDG